LFLFLSKIVILQFYSLESGLIVRGVVQEDEGCWWGRAKGAEGIFPAECVQVLRGDPEQLPLKSIEEELEQGEDGGAPHEQKEGGEQKKETHEEEKSKEKETPSANEPDDAQPVPANEDEHKAKPAEENPAMTATATEKGDGESKVEASAEADSSEDAPPPAVRSILFSSLLSLFASETVIWSLTACRGVSQYRNPSMWVALPVKSGSSPSPTTTARCAFFALRS
jgi:hypothetical protein